MKKPSKLTNKVRIETSFAKYRGIGNPKMPSGRKAIVTWLRKLREQ